MKSRLEDVPVLKTVPVIVAAPYYNRVKVALSRLENPIILDLPDLRDLALLIDENVWICVDKSLDDLPVLAWTDFESRERSGLHEPVHCKLRFYHAQAELIIQTIYDDIDNILNERLGNQAATVSTDVSQLKDHKKD